MQGISFNTQGVKAIRDGVKTMTRRPVKLPEKMIGEGYNTDDIENEKFGNFGLEICSGDSSYSIYPKYKVGETVFIQEEFATVTTTFIGQGQVTATLYKERDEKKEYEPEPNWQPASEMQEHQARTYRKIKSIKVERLQDISGDDCYKEGIDFEYVEFDTREQAVFVGTIWSNLPYKEPYRWEDNPYVFAYEFEVIKDD